MAKFSVIYDACVLYPAPLRDLLMRLAATDLFKAHWTDTIHEEWITALLRQGKYRREDLEKTRDLMDRHIKDAKVYDYEVFIERLELPDANDRHVLAAAIKINADAIVSFNVRDFPPTILNRYGMELIHPDDFVCEQFESNPMLCCKVIQNQRLALKNPPKSSKEFLAILQRQSLPKMSSVLSQYIDLI